MYLLIVIIFWCKNRKQISIDFYGLLNDGSIQAAFCTFHFLIVHNLSSRTQRDVQAITMLSPQCIVQYAQSMTSKIEWKNPVLARSAVPSAYYDISMKDRSFGAPCPTLHRGSRSNSKIGVNKTENTFNPSCGIRHKRVHQYWKSHNEQHKLLYKQHYKQQKLKQ